MELDTGTPLAKVQVTWLALSTTPVPTTPSILQSVDSAPVSKLVPEIVSVLASVSAIEEIVGL